MNRMQQRESAARNNGFSVPDGGFLEVCQDVYMSRCGTTGRFSDEDETARIEYLRAVLDTWDYKNETVYDVLVRKIVVAVVGGTAEIAA